jgi:hypothetical protein
MRKGIAPWFQREPGLELQVFIGMDDATILLRAKAGTRILRPETTWKKNSSTISERSTLE